MKTKLLIAFCLVKAFAISAHPLCKPSADDCDTPAPLVLDDAPILCGSSTIADLQAEGQMIKWYTTETGGNVLPETTLLTDAVYYASQTMGCESEQRTAVYVTINAPEPPTGDAVQHFCFAGTVGDLYSDNAMYWYDAPSGGNILSMNTPLVNLETYFASAVADGCESSARLAVEVILHTPPVDALQDVTNCTGYTLPALNNGNYYTDMGGTGSILLPGALISQTATIYIYNEYDTPPGCSNESSFTVTIPQVGAPTGNGLQIIEVTDGAQATIEDIIAEAEGTITWHLTEEDALSGQNALPAGTLLVNGQVYYGVQSIGNCAGTSALAVTVNMVLGNKDFNAGSFSYYPNPVSGALSFSYTTKIDAVEVLDALGQIVLSAQVNLDHGQIDMSALAVGVYLVKVYGNNARAVVKIIKE